MAKHYIYEIFGKKVGVTNDVARRMREQKVKKGEYRVIEEHSNIKTASIREKELQIELNYPVDKLPYWKSLKWTKKAMSPESRAKIDYKKMSEDRLGKPIHSKEHIEKMYKAVEQYDLQGNFIKRWNSIKEAEQYFNPSKKTHDNIGNCCRGNQKSAYKHIWKFIN